MPTNHPKQALVHHDTMTKAYSFSPQKKNLRIKNKKKTTPPPGLSNRPTESRGTSSCCERLPMLSGSSSADLPAKGVSGVFNVYFLEYVFFSYGFCLSSSIQILYKIISMIKKCLRLVKWISCLRWRLCGASNTQQKGCECTHRSCKQCKTLSCTGKTHQQRHPLGMSKW